MYPSFAVNSKAEFGVHWDDGYPTAALSCTPGCIVSGQTCLCDFTTTEVAFHTDAGSLPSVAELKLALKFGSVEPFSFAVGTYSECSTAACTASSEIKVFFKNGGSFDIFTIFQLPPLRDGAPPQWLLNRQSTVIVGAYSFRNPPHFMPMLGGQRFVNAYWDGLFGPIGLANAEAETSALLDHLFEHKNVAPFIANRLIQKLITSNPSPRYVAAAAKAFSTGTYDGHTYSGKYGDMGAMVAAIMLDREALADPRVPIPRLDAYASRSLW
jgi:hypothetical protein